MWVAPEARRTGAATKLIEAVAAWATGRGARTLRTSVTVGNAGAENLYARAGFADTGERKPLDHEDVDTGAVVAELTRSLAERSP
jgi:GNAT superfamily N-acetyltransferase